MAKEIIFADTTGQVDYVCLTDAIGGWYNTAGARFENYVAGNFTDYDLAATEAGASGIYTADMPAAIGAATYGVQARRRAGGSPAQSDAIVGGGNIDWNGTDSVGAGNASLSTDGVQAVKDAIVTNTITVTVDGAADANIQYVVNDFVAADGLAAAGEDYAGTGTFEANVFSMSTDVITAAAVSAAAVTKIQAPLNVNTYAEPTGVPGATVTLADKIGRLYAALINQLDVTATAMTFYSHAGVSQWSKVLSDDGTTYRETVGA